MNLTSKYQHSFLCPDGKRRNFMLYFLNGIQILKLKVPFNEKYMGVYQSGPPYNETSFENERIVGSNLLMDKIKNGKVRQVKYPISKEKLNQALCQEK